MCCGKICWKGADQKADRSLSQKRKEQGHPRGNSGETVFVCVLQVNSAHGEVIQMQDSGSFCVSVSVRKCLTKAFHSSPTADLHVQPH